MVKRADGVSAHRELAARRFYTLDAMVKKNFLVYGDAPKSRKTCNRYQASINW